MSIVNASLFEPRLKAALLRATAGLGIFSKNTLSPVEPDRK
jgi:hypothetical protein